MNKEVNCLILENYTRKNICWWIVLLFFLQIILTTNSFLVLCFFFSTLLTIKYIKFLKYYLPKGILLYILWAIIPLIIGLLNGNEYRDIIRTMSYFFNGVMALLFGTVLVLKFKNYDLWKTILFIQVLFTFWCFIIAVPQLGSGYNDLRQALSLEFIFPVFVLDKISDNRNYFNKKIDVFIIILFLVRILLCLSRTTIIGALVGCLIYYYFLDNRKKNVKLFKRVVFITFFILFAVYTILTLVPDNVIEPFVSKFSNIFSEMSTKETFASYSDALANWRGYENNAAIIQWNNYDLFSKLFGNGFGGLIKMKYISSLWSGMNFYDKGAIPFLHNGFFTILCIEGIIGLIIFIRIFVKNIIYAIRVRKYYGIYNETAKYIMLFVLMILNTYVTRGLFASEMYLSWGIIIGVCNYEIKLKMNKLKNQNLNLNHQRV